MNKKTKGVNYYSILETCKIFACQRLVNSILLHFSAAYLKSLTPSSFQCIVKLNEFNGFMEPQCCLWIFWSCHISLHFRIALTTRWLSLYIHIQLTQYKCYRLFFPYLGLQHFMIPWACMIATGSTIFTGLLVIMPSHTRDCG